MGFSDILTLPKTPREMMREAVAATEAVLLARLKVLDSKIKGIHFICAPPDEIIETLQDMEGAQQNQFLKYPLVALFEDITVRKGLNTGYFGDTTFNYIVATQTEAGYKSDEREQKTFIPILRPIDEELEKQLLLLPYFVHEEFALRRTVTDRKRWGRDGLYGKDGNLFADRIDAIETQNAELRLRTP